MLLSKEFKSFSELSLMGLFGDAGVLGPAQATVSRRAHPQGDRGVQQTMFSLVVQSLRTG